jgi:hypothetical protein
VSLQGSVLEPVQMTEFYFLKQEGFVMLLQTKLFHCNVDKFVATENSVNVTWTQILFLAAAFVIASFRNIT